MNHRLLVDINVLLDVLANRQPHYDASAAVWAAVETRTVVGWVSANSITTLYYLLRKVSNHATALRGIRLVNEVFMVAPVDASLIEKALVSPLGDFEDAVQYENALRAKATAIVTRDVRHFRHSAIPVLTPDAFLATAGLK